MLRWGRVVLAACTLALPGCVYIEHISVSGPPERPVLTIKPAHRGWMSPASVGIDTLWVQDLDEARAQRLADGDAKPSVDDHWARWRKTLVWNLAGDHGCAKGPTRIEYGVAPPGFRELPEPGPARPLVPGHVYSVSVGGCGFMGGGYFKISDNQIRFAERVEDLD